ncbi:MAG: hypothetical protein AVDCRST_MAG52-148, partial [uncultured Blastococcus sp.]
ERSDRPGADPGRDRGHPRGAGPDRRRAQRPAGRPRAGEGDRRPRQGHRRRDLPREPAGRDRRRRGTGGTGPRGDHLAPEAHHVARRSKEEAL